MESALRRPCEGVRAAEERSFKRILNLVFVPSDEMKTRHWRTSLAHGSQDCLDVGAPGYEKGKRRDCVVKYRAIHTSMYDELSEHDAYGVPFYS